MNKRWSIVLLIIAAAGFFGWRWMWISHNIFNTDELEYLHAAWSVGQGLVLYRDFFEYHGPLFPYLFAPLTLITADPIHGLMLGRIASWGIGVATLIVLWRLALQQISRQSAWIAVVLFLSFSWIDKLFEIRPEGTSVLFLLLGLLTLSRSRSQTSCVWAGVWMGVSLLFTPKTVYACGGLLTAFLWTSFRSRQFIAGLRSVATIAVGAGCPLLVVVLAFASVHSVDDFIRCFWTFNTHFRATFSAWPLLLQSILQNPFLWFFGVLGAFAFSAPALWKGLAFGALAGFFLLPVVYPQYPLILMAALALLAAWSLAHFLKGLAAAIGVVALGIGIFFQSRLWVSNTDQIAEIHCVHSRLTQTERFFDVWTGVGVFRPHAFYYWFLHEEVLVMLNPTWLEKSLLRVLADPKTKGFVWGSYFDRLPESVKKQAREQYEPAGCSRLFLRKAQNL